MNPGWQGGRSLQVVSYDGRHNMLAASKEWRHPDGRRFLLPADATTDGASVPDALASAGLTFWGPWWMASVLHDCAYRNSLLQWNSAREIWELASLSFEDANSLFKTAMDLDHVEPAIITLYSEAVALCGKSSFTLARAAGHPQPLICNP